MEVFRWQEKTRAQNFAVKKESMCMECGRTFFTGKGIYARRFCSEDCKMRYFL